MSMNMSINAKQQYFVPIKLNDLTVYCSSTKTPFLSPEIIMTPSKKGRATHIRIERRRKLQMNGTEPEQRHHVAGGEHKGLVINKSSQGRSAH